MTLLPSIIHQSTSSCRSSCRESLGKDPNASNATCSYVLRSDPLVALAVHVDGLEDRGSNFKKARLLAGSFFLLFCRLWPSGPSKYLLARPAEPRDGRGVPALKRADG